MGNKKCSIFVLFHMQAVMVNALIAYYTNRQRRNSTAAANASSDEIDGGIHGEQDLDGKSCTTRLIDYQVKLLSN